MIFYIRTNWTRALAIDDWPTATGAALFIYIFFPWGLIFISRAKAARFLQVDGDDPVIRIDEKIQSRPVDSVRCPFAGWFSLLARYSLPPPLFLIVCRFFVSCPVPEANPLNVGDKWRRSPSAHPYMSETSASQPASANQLFSYYTMYT